MNQRLKRRILRRDKHTCRYCGNTGVKLTIDHIFPRARGGHHFKKANLVAACLRCNQAKANMTPEEAGMPILSEGWSYTPPGKLDDGVQMLSSLTVVTFSRRKYKRQQRIHRKQLLKNMEQTNA